MVRRNRGILVLIFFLTAACGGSIPYSGEFLGGGGFADGGPPGTGNTGAGEGVIALADAGPLPDASAALDAGDVNADAGDVADGDGGPDADAGGDAGDESDAGFGGDVDAGADGDAGVDDDNDAGEKKDGGKDKADRKDRKDCPKASKHGRGRGKGCGGQDWAGGVPTAST